MREHPIILDGPMVRAILENRKTQIRVAISGLPEGDLLFGGWRFDGGLSFITEDDAEIVIPERFNNGDRLWVRETYNTDWCDHTIYRADGGSASEAGYKSEPRWRPSSCMPRSASRITLDIKTADIQRIQQMTPEDIIAEGFDTLPLWREYWDAHNAKHPWGSNPWVWVLHTSESRPSPPASAPGAAPTTRLG